MNQIMCWKLTRDLFVIQTAAWAGWLAATPWRCSVARLANASPLGALATWCASRRRASRASACMTVTVAASWSSPRRLRQCALACCVCSALRRRRWSEPSRRRARWGSVGRQAFSQKWQFFQKCSYPKKNCSYIQNHTVTHFSRSLV